MRATLIVCLTLGLAVVAPPMSTAQTNCFGQTGYATLANQAFAKEQIINARDRFEHWYAQLSAAQKDEEKDKNEWQIHVDWSIQDHGFVEPEIQKTWQIDLHIWEACICAPGQGRKTAMQIAIARAKANDCASAALITRSTQLHNPEAIGVFNQLDENVLCKYLKAK